MSHAGVECRLRDQNLLTVDALLFMQRTADHLDGALLGQVYQAAGDCRHAEVDVTGCDRNGHGLSRLKEDETPRPDLAA